MTRQSARAKRRVIKERDELLVKLTKLYEYLVKSAASGKDVQQRELLMKQSTIMNNYIEVLNERLDAWEE